MNQNLSENLKPVKEENVYSKITLDDVKKNWRDILEAFKSRHQMVLFAALTTGKPVKCDRGIITIKYGKDYSFHKQRLEKDENRKIVNEIFSGVLKEKVTVKYVIEDQGDCGSKSKEQLLKDTFGEDMVEIFDE
jgi:DNA polymerase-3 subunit gamma/tau